MPKARVCMRGCGKSARPVRRGVGLRARGAPRLLYRFPLPSLLAWFLSLLIFRGLGLRLPSLGEDFGNSMDIRPCPSPCLHPRFVFFSPPQLFQKFFWTNHRHYVTLLAKVNSIKLRNENWQHGNKGEYRYGSHR